MITIEKVIFRSAHYLVLLLSACSTNGQELVARYEIDDTEMPAVDEGFAFSEKRGLVVTYAKPYTSKYFDEPYDFNSSAFRYRDADGLVLEAVTRISIPRDIESRKKWSAFGSECTSRQSGKRYHVQCDGSRGAQYYIYSDDLGIEEFSFPCTAGISCNYKLVSGKGIFSDL